MRPPPIRYCGAATLPASGKVDRKALVKPEITVDTGRTIEPPATPMEEKLHAIWTEAFAPQPVSVTDDLFEDLGGHSLKAARLVSARARSRAGGLSLEDLYAAPTIRALATRIGGAAAVAVQTEESFHRVPEWKRWLCVAAQTVALLPVYTIAGCSGSFHVAYTHLAGRMPRIDALILSALFFTIVPVASMLFSILAKWLIAGAVQGGDYPLWGGTYFRWWLVRRIIAVTATPSGGTPIPGLLPDAGREDRQARPYRQWRDRYRRPVRLRRRCHRQRPGGDGDQFGRARPVAAGHGDAGRPRVRRRAGGGRRNSALGMTPSSTTWPRFPLKR